MQGIFRFARHVAFVTLVVRALMPTGWMPVANADTLITICSVEGQKVLHPDAPAQDMPYEDCPFGAAAPHVAFVPNAPALTGPAVHEREATADRIYAAAIVARFTPGFPRAPPLNA